ncbi:MAG: fumarylacetoacetate hydrolase family protein [Acidimicrobiia bacterium]|nr:fumarylacetoacetate hydrolase family protein [Acidimicrobiia bacterium]
MGFKFANVAGRSALIDAGGAWYDAERVSAGAIAADPMTALGSPDALHAAAALLAGASSDGALADADVRAPVPTPRSVFGVGLNYASHAAESGVELPENPVVFTKFPSCIVGPTSDVELRSTTGDYEVELVVVIGGDTRDVAEDRAWEHVLGLTVGQDISDRALQFAAQPAHFDLGKSRDTYGPIGPVLVSTDGFDDPTDLALRSEINGEPRQNDRTSNLIFSVAQLVSYLSSIMTLRTGDLIFTGTPEGVGVASRSFLAPGDVITSTIDGIGTMTNRCVE